MRHRQLRFGLPAVALGAALLVAACGGDATGPAASVAPAQDKVTVTPATAATPFALQAGTYRLNWTTSCPKVAVTITSDTGYNKSKASGIANFSWILTSVTPGNYTVSQTEAACTDWTIILEKVGGS